MSFLKVGDPAPDFSAVTDDDTTLTLAALRGKKVILYFYPKDDTPGCTAQACGLRDSYPLIEEKNGVVLGVSPDSAKSHLKFRLKYNLPFTLLADTEHVIAEAYGVWQEKSMYGKKYMGIERSQFIIDEAGTLVDVQYSIKPAASAEVAVQVLG
jgi:thioredoxin-dependent peroxiredoxin